MTEIVNKKVPNELGIVFKTVKFRNFMSFGNLWTEVSLEGSGTTLIVGENLDDGGSSGAGKSTLINAISYCLYDKIPASVSKDKLINRTNDKKNTLMEVSLTFTKGEELYTVKRWRGSSTGVMLTVNKGGESVDLTPASVNRGEDNFNVKIEEIVGFSYNLFSQIILFNGNSKPFLDLSVGEQRDLIEELFRITILSRKAAVLKKDINDIDKTIDLQTQKIEYQKKQNELHAKRVIEAQDRVNRWEHTHQAELTKLASTLEQLSNVDFTSEETIHSEITKLNAEVLELQSKIREEKSLFDATLSALETQAYSKSREKLPEDHILVSRDRNELLTKANKISKELVHLRDAKCPYCLQKFSYAVSKITELELQEQELITQAEAKEVEYKELVEKNLRLREQQNAEVTELKSLIEKHKASQTQSIHAPSLAEKQATLSELKSALSYRDLASLMKAKSDLESLANKLELMQVEVNPHVEALQALIKEGEVKVETEELDELNKFQEHQQFLLKLLTDKNSFIRKGIIAKTIPFLNKRIAYYTVKLNLPHVVLFQPDMSCEISQIGRNLDHGNLSNGERKKLNLSLCLAFRDVLTYLHAKVNVLLTDEIDGGSLSGIDIESLISMLKSKAWDDNIGIFIVSHRQEFEGRCDHILTVRKESGFSTLITQPDD